MPWTRSAAAMLLLAGLALAGCQRADHDTAVLGGSPPAANRAGPPAGTEASGPPVPMPPAPAGTQPQLARYGEQATLAVWVQDGHVVAAAHAPGAGWSEARPLEQIYGKASDPQLASNGQGVAMAVWRHTVGSIQSLRFSRFDQATGWSTPDVLPGALPRPHGAGASGADEAPQLAMDPQGIVTARWPSGLAAHEEQTARHVPGQGWSRALSVPVAAASAPPAASAPEPPAASAPR